VTVEVEDGNGQVDVAEARIFVPELGREEGQIEPRGEGLDLSGIEASADKVADSMVDAVRASIVIGLFALAAVVLSLLGWRLTRAGGLLLRPATGAAFKRRKAAKRRSERPDFEMPSRNGAAAPSDRRERAGLLVD
jgi:hypothetical protein